MGGGVWGQDWAKAGTVKSKNMASVFKKHLLRFRFLRLRSKTRLNEWNGAINREGSRLTYGGMLCNFA